MTTGDNIYTVNHGTSVIKLGSLTHSGILKGIKLTAEAKEQGWSNKCSSFTLDITRDGKSIASVNQNLGRSEKYKTFSIDPVVEPNTMVQEGDIVTITIKVKGWWQICSAWIKDIVVVVTVDDTK